MDQDKKKTAGYIMGQVAAIVIASCVLSLLVGLTIKVLSFMF